MAEVSIDSQSPEDKINETLRIAKFEADRCLRSLALDTSDERPAYVYALFRPDGSIRYVGKGTKRRINSHQKLGAKHENRRLASDYQKYGRLVARKIVTELTHEEAFAVEETLVRYWGIEADGLGPLANLDYGGGGGAEKSDETRQKLSFVAKSSWVGEGVREARVESMKQTWTDDEVRERRRGGIKGAWSRQETKERRAASLNATLATPEMRKLRSENSKKLAAKPGVNDARRAKMQALWNDPEYRARCAAKRAAYEERRKAEGISEERRKEYSAASKRGWIRRKANAI